MITRIPNVHGSHALWLEVVNRIIGDGPRDSLLDICCGGCATTRHLVFPVKYCVDVNDHPERPTDVGFLQMDAIEYLKCQWDNRNAFDVSIISDGLEHFTKLDSVIVLEGMRRISKLSIIFVPTNDSKITPDSLDPHAHKSAWTPEEFDSMGYTVEEYPDWHTPQLELGALFAWIRESDLTES